MLQLVVAQIEAGEVDKVFQAVDVFDEIVIQLKVFQTRC